MIIIEMRIEIFKIVPEYEIGQKYIKNNNFYSRDKSDLQTIITK